MDSYFADPDAVSPYLLKRKRFYSEEDWNAMMEKVRNATWLYVGNVNKAATERQVRVFFEQAGTVTRVVMGLNRYTKENAGFCFVEYATKEECRFARLNLTLAKLCGQPVRCDPDPGYEDGRQWARGRDGRQFREWKRDRDFGKDRNYRSHYGGHRSRRGGRERYSDQGYHRRGRGYQRGHDHPRGHDRRRRRDDDIIVSDDLRRQAQQQRGVRGRGRDDYTTDRFGRVIPPARKSRSRSRDRRRSRSRSISPVRD
ncbi:MAG: hypothetical protein MHM6MM_005455 [Cercozoa sp. M6MM]